MPKINFIQSKRHLKRKVASSTSRTLQSFNRATVCLNQLNIVEPNNSQSQSTFEEINNSPSRIIGCSPLSSGFNNLGGDNSDSPSENNQSTKLESELRSWSIKYGISCKATSYKYRQCHSVVFHIGGPETSIKAWIFINYLNIFF